RLRRGTLFVGLVVAACVATGCEKSPPEQSAREVASAKAAPSAAPKPAAPIATFRDKRPAAERVLAIGDLHGDLQAARSTLRLAGAIDDKDQWVGGKLVVVQTGDQIDRGDDDRKILDLTEKLKAQASAAGGAFVAMVG